MESCWGEENMKKAIAKCSHEDAPELSLPPYRSSYRFVNTMINKGDNYENINDMATMFAKMMHKMKNMNNMMNDHSSSSYNSDDNDMYDMFSEMFDIVTRLICPLLEPSQTFPLTVKGLAFAGQPRQSHGQEFQVLDPTCYHY